MAKFLNKDGILESLKTIFETAEREIIIVVPYIKLSDSSYSLLQSANNRGIELSIIYKEGTLSNTDNNRLSSLDNLNLLTHSDIHAKCYCNENLLLIGSMNLYTYSEKYNREMAILIGNEDNNYQDYKIHQNAMDEVRSIVNSSKIEKRSARTLKGGFNLLLIKPAKDFIQVDCNYINKHFDNKTFEVTEYLEIRCSNYTDKIDVLVECDFSNKSYNEGEKPFNIRRAVFILKWEKEILNQIHPKFQAMLSTDSTLSSFQVFWDYPTSKFTLYRDRKKEPKWDEINDQQTIKKFKQGIDHVTEEIRKIERNLR